MAEEKDRRITELEAEVRRWGRAYLEVSQREADREGERDAALAVIEKVRNATDPRWQGIQSWEKREAWIREQVATVDTSALAEHDAETRRKAFGEALEIAERSVAPWIEIRALAEKGADDG